MHGDAPFVALFCPRCGEHVNAEDLDNDHGYTPEQVVVAASPEWPVDLGGEYTCFHCKTRTRDWNHVRRCRGDAPPIVRQRQHTARGADLQRLLEELR